MNRLARDSAPEPSTTLEGGTPRATASARLASSFARPCVGAAATPSDRTPSRSASPGRDLGRTETKMRAPSGLGRMSTRYTLTPTAMTGTSRGTVEPRRAGGGASPVASTPPNIIPELPPERRLDPEVTQ